MTTNPPAADDMAPTVATGGGGHCLGRYFAGVPRHPVAPVEDGTHDFDVIGANQPSGARSGCA